MFAGICLCLGLPAGVRAADAESLHNRQTSGGYRVIDGQSSDWLVLGINAGGKLAKDWTVYGEVQFEFSGKGANNSASISVRHYW